ncbi:hypothetical protein Peur_005510 [Populus x canadensis]
MRGERRQMFLHDYPELYCATEHDDLIFQQRSQIVHWIVEFYRTVLLMFLGLELALYKWSRRRISNPRLASGGKKAHRRLNPMPAMNPLLYRIGTESEIYTNGKLRVVHTENKIKCVLKMPLSLYICYLLDRLEPLEARHDGPVPSSCR